MLVISDSAALGRALMFPLDSQLRDLLLMREQQLGGQIAGTARLVIVEPHDRTRWLEQALGFSIFQNAGDGTWYGDPDYSPGFDTLKDHGFAYELTFELTTDFTHVVIIEKAQGVHQDLLEFCATYASEHA